MDRLTGWDGEHSYLLKCFEGNGCEDMETTKCNLCEHNIAIFDRLAAYEDTGLTSDEVVALDHNVVMLKQSARLVNELSRAVSNLHGQLSATQAREHEAIEALSRIRRDINEPDKIYIHVSDFWGKWSDKQVAVDEQKCRICGCTRDNACLGGCYWIEDDLCSQCADIIAEIVVYEVALADPDVRQEQAEYYKHLLRSARDELHSKEDKQ